MAEQKPRKTLNTNWTRKKASATAVTKFEEQFKKMSGVDLGETNDEYEVVSTGSLNLDYALTIGGLPTGRIVEIWGPEHAGKTTLACIMAREYQKKYPDQRVAWVDMEQTFDVKWAASLGVDVGALWRPPVKTAEEVADYVKSFVESGLCSFVVLDSIGGMIARMEYEKQADEATVGLVAKVVTRMVKQVSPMAKSNGTTVAVINQVRANIGYGADETTAGGWALKHVTTMKIQVKRGGATPHTVTVDSKPLPVGHEMAVKVQKNKLGPYGKVASIWLHNVATDKYGPIGVDMVAETFDFAKRYGFFGDKTGSGTFVMPDDSVIRKGEKVVEAMRENPGWVEVLRARVLETLQGQITDEGEPVVTEDDAFAAAMKS